MSDEPGKTEFDIANNTRGTADSLRQMGFEQATTPDVRDDLLDDLLSRLYAPPASSGQRGGSSGTPP